MLLNGFRDCHKQALNNKTVWNWLSNILQYIISVNKMLKIIFFSFFIKSSHFIASSPMYELLINHLSLF